MTEVASSGNVAGMKEQAEVGNPEPGDYVLRVVNFASATPTYDLEATLFNSAVVSSEEVPGLIENWTLTCEQDGKVLQQVPVIIDRGEQSKIDLRTCINRSRSLR